MDSDLDEVDAFNSNREKIFLDGAGEYGQENEVLDFSDEEVMEINENEDGDDDEQNDVSDDDDALLDDEGAPEDEENDHGWGGRQDYYGGASPRSLEWAGASPSPATKVQTQDTTVTIIFAALPVSMNLKNHQHLH